MPPCTENFTGQPMLMSIARTSAHTTCAALSASPAEAVPSWKATRSCGTVLKMSLPLSCLKSIVPRAAFSLRRHCTTDRSTSSSEYTMLAPYSRASSLKGRVLTRTIGASARMLR